MAGKALTQENIRAVLHGIYDPEIPISIIDLGLVYGVEILPDNVVDITMTLTTMGCPMITGFIEQVKETIAEEIAEVKYVNVNITFDPPWNISMVNEEALFALGVSSAGSQNA